MLKAFIPTSLPPGFSGTLSKGLSVIAIGPKGGKIVGYDNHGEPIYAGSPKAQKLESLAKEAKDVHEWLKTLQMSHASVPGDPGSLSVSAADAAKLMAAFNVLGKKIGNTVVFKAHDLVPHLGKTLLHSDPKVQLVHVAALSAGVHGGAAVIPPEKLSTLKVKGPLPGATHGGKLLTDEKGKLYAFKTNEGFGTAPTMAEEAFARVANLVAPGMCQQAQVATLDGEVGVIIPWIEHEATLGTSPSKSALQASAVDLAKHQVLDWLMAQHDAHGANFLVTKNGLVGIDKGQAFKWIGSDTLSSTFKKNEHTPAYNLLWQGIANGTIKVSEEAIVDAVADMVLSIEKNLSEEQYKGILGPYLAAVSGSETGKGANAEAKWAEAKKRLHSLRSDFEAFLSAQFKHPVKLPLAPPAALTTVPADAPVAAPAPLPPPAPVPEASPPLEQAPAVVGMPGWPKKKGQVTVHHPGVAPPATTKWPSGYPGPGYHAEVLYKGKTFTFTFVDDGGKFGCKVKWEGGETLANSPQNAADIPQLLDKGLPLTMTATEKKAAKLGYTVTKLLQLPAFEEDFKAAATTTSSATAQVSGKTAVGVATVKELEAEKVVTPAQKKLTASEVLAAAPDGVLSDTTTLIPDVILAKNAPLLLKKNSGVGTPVVAAVNADGSMALFAVGPHITVELGSPSAILEHTANFKAMPEYAAFVAPKTPPAPPQEMKALPSPTAGHLLSAPIGSKIVTIGGPLAAIKEDDSGEWALIDNVTGQKSGITMKAGSLAASGKSVLLKPTTAEDLTSSLVTAADYLSPGHVIVEKKKDGGTMKWIVSDTDGVVSENGVAMSTAQLKSHIEESGSSLSYATLDWQLPSWDAISNIPDGVPFWRAIGGKQHLLVKKGGKLWKLAQYMDGPAQEEAMGAVAAGSGLIALAPESALAPDVAAAIAAIVDPYAVTEEEPHTPGKLNAPPEIAQTVSSSGVQLTAGSELLLHLAPLFSVVADAATGKPVAMKVSQDHWVGSDGTDFGAGAELAAKKHFLHSHLSNPGFLPTTPAPISIANPIKVKVGGKLEGWTPAIAEAAASGAHIEKDDGPPWVPPPGVPLAFEIKGHKFEVMQLGPWGAFHNPNLDVDGSSKAIVSIDGKAHEVHALVGTVDGLIKYAIHDACDVNEIPLKEWPSHAELEDILSELSFPMGSTNLDYVDATPPPPLAAVIGDAKTTADIPEEVKTQAVTKTLTLADAIASKEILAKYGLSLKQDKYLNATLTSGAGFAVGGNAVAALQNFLNDHGHSHVKAIASAFSKKGAYCFTKDLDLNAKVGVVISVAEAMTTPPAVPPKGDWWEQKVLSGPAAGKTLQQALASGSFPESHAALASIPEGTIVTAWNTDFGESLKYVKGKGDLFAIDFLDGNDPLVDGTSVATLAKAVLNGSIVLHAGVDIPTSLSEVKKPSAGEAPAVKAPAAKPAPMTITVPEILSTEEDFAALPSGTIISAGKFLQYKKVGDQWAVLHSNGQTTADSTFSAASMKLQAKWDAHKVVSVPEEYGTVVVDKKAQAVTAPPAVLESGPALPSSNPALGVIDITEPALSALPIGTKLGLWKQEPDGLKPSPGVAWPMTKTEKGWQPANGNAPLANDKFVALLGDSAFKVKVESAGPLKITAGSTKALAALPVGAKIAAQVEGSLAGAVYVKTGADSWMNHHGKSSIPSQDLSFVDHIASNPNENYAVIDDAGSKTPPLTEGDLDALPDGTVVAESGISTKLYKKIDGEWFGKTPSGLSFSETLSLSSAVLHHTFKGDLVIVQTADKQFPATPTGPGYSGALAAPAAAKAPATTDLAAAMAALSPGDSSTFTSKAKTVSKVWKHATTAQHMANAPIGTQVVMPDGKTFLKTAASSGYYWSNASLSAWKYFDSDGGLLPTPFDPDGGLYANMKALFGQMAGGAIVLPGAAAPKKTALAPPAPKPAPVVPKQKTPEQLAAEAAKKAEIAKVVEKAKAVASWKKEHAPPTGLLKDALSWLGADVEKVQPGSMKDGLHSFVNGKDLLVAPANNDLSGLSKVLGGGDVVDTPFGKMLKVPAKSVTDKYPGAAKVMGPDGKEYPAGTTWSTTSKEIVTKTKEAALTASGGKIAPWQDTDPEKAKELKAVKFSGKDKDEALAKVKAAKLSPKTPAIVGGYNVIVGVSAAELAEAHTTETQVTTEAKVPPQPAPVKRAAPPKGTATGLEVPPQKSVGEPNDHLLGAAWELKPPPGGFNIRVGDPGVLWGSTLKVKRIVRPDGTKYLEVIGDARSFDPTKAAGLSSGSCKLHVDDIASGPKKWGYDPETGEHRLGGSTKSFSGFTGKTAAGTSIEVGATGPGSAASFRGLFTFRIPEGADPESEIRDAFKAMGIDPDKALASHSDPSVEEKFVKAQIVRAGLGVKGYFGKDAAGAKLTPEKYGDEAWLDKQLKSLGMSHLVDTATIEVGLAGLQSVVVNDPKEAAFIDDKVQCLGHGFGGNDPVNLALQITRSGGFSSRRQGYLAGTSVGAMNAGGSPGADENTGGASGAAFRIHTKSHVDTSWSGVGGGAEARVILHPRVLRRTDFYMHDGDAYQSTSLDVASGDKDAFQWSGNNREKMSEVGDGNETCFEHGIGIADVAGVVFRTESTRQDAIKRWKAENPGKNDVGNGLAPEDFFVTVSASSYGGHSAKDIVAKLKGLKPGVLP